MGKMPFLKDKKSIYVIAILVLILLSGFTFVNVNEVVGLRHPESAYFYKNYIYVSNIGLSPTSQNLDGFITKLDRYGNILEYKFIDGLKAPKGIFPYKDKLFIADLDRVCVASLINGKKYCIPVPGGRFLNDIYVLDGDAYVTDTIRNCIYKISKDGVVNKFYCTDNFSPNGIWFSKKLNAFVVVSFNKPVVSIIDLSGNLLKKHKLDGLTGFDGLIVKGNDVYISDYRTGVVIKTDLQYKKYSVVKNFNTPVADFFIDNKTLIAPLLEKNKLFIGKFE